MDAPPTPSAPPTTPGTIPDPRASRLPVAAKIVAILDILFGAFAAFSAINEGNPFEPSMMIFAVFLPLGAGVLLRSNVLRILARIAHALFGGLLIVGMAFTIFGLLTGGGLGQSASGGLMVAMMIFLTAWLLGLAAFFVWGFFVLGRKDVRAACRRRSIEKQTG